jgi:3-deoxy-D-manno-octulosonate 8-phosphate phosphatase (KDO 8-P phosphatase)
MSKKRARKIKLLLFDVDGVFTDGKLFIIPTSESSEEPSGAPGEGFIEVKGFHAHDGAGISLAHLAGIKTGMITKRVSQTVALRARDLNIKYVHQGIQDKLAAFEEIIEEAGILPNEAAFVGDDVIDLPAMRSCGFAIAVANARDEVQEEAHYTTPHSGGDGALRDAIEYILKAQGKWEDVVDQYIGAKIPPKKALALEDVGMKDLIPDDNSSKKASRR